MQVYIGDIHSQYVQLLALLQWVDRLRGDNSDYTFECIFLGDLFDSRMTDEDMNKPPHASAVKIVNIVQQCMDLYPTVVLQSNHQDKLKRYLRHRRESPNKKNPVQLTCGLSHTVDEFLLACNDRQLTNLEDWLSHKPYLIQRQGFDQHLGKICTFNAAHAYYNAHAGTHNLSAKHKSQAIYGLLKPDNTRTEWWLENREGGNVFISGHYHVDYMSDYNRIIDAGCGGDDGKLIGYIPALGLKEYF